MKDEKIQIAYGELQSVLAMLGTLSPRAESKPAFHMRDQAEQLIAVVAEHEGQDLQLYPVWNIDHDDLAASEIVAWSVTPNIN